MPLSISDSQELLAAPRKTLNQATPLPEFNSWQNDQSSRWWLSHMLDSCGVHGLSESQEGRLQDVGRSVGSAHLREAADEANRSDPQLATFDRWGNRIDEVKFNPAWYEVLHAVTQSSVCGLPWLDDKSGYLVRTAAMEQWARLDMGVMCPVTMTTAAVPVLERSDADSPGLLMRDRILESANNKLRDGHPMVGMAMTEPQGGSDLSGCSVVARPSDENTFAIFGHKWFVSHAVADGLLVLAKEDGLGEGSQAISCFYVPGWTDEGERNGIEIQRLKDKLGTRSLASAEVIFNGSRATRIGAPGRGIATIIEMVVHTRMDCAIGSTGILSRAIAETLHYVRGRSAFGNKLVDQPLMRSVLADLLLEREASLALVYEISRNFQLKDPLMRLVTAASKYWITRRAVLGCVECVETLGGNGYVEEFPLARLYRDVQVNSTWEGSGNVMALDVLRTISRFPEQMSDLRSRVSELIDNADDKLGSVIASQKILHAPSSNQSQARHVSGQIALVLQAALLAHRSAVTGRESDLLIAKAFIDTRLNPSAERVFGDSGGSEVLMDASEALLALAPLPVI